MKKLLLGWFACISSFALVACDGEPAPIVTPPPPPPPAHAQLVRQDVEPPGSNCPDSGTAIHTGIDDDGDGLLDDAEIDATAYVCTVIESPDVVWFGDAKEADWDDVAKRRRLEHARVVTGSLELPADETLELPALEQVDGNLVLRQGKSDTATVRLPALVAVGGDVVTGTESRGTLALPALHHLDGSLHLAGNLATIALDQLESIDGNMELRGTAMTALALPALTTLGGSLVNSFEGEVRLETLDVPVLATVGGSVQLYTFHMRALEAVKLAHIGGVLSVDGSTIETVGLDSLTDVGNGVQLMTKASTVRLPLLETISDHGGNGLGLGIYGVGVVTLDLPALRTLDGPLRIRDCEQLRSVSLARLSALNDLFDLDGDPVLESFAAPAVMFARRMQLKELPALVHLDLGALNDIGGTLELTHVGLTDLTGFPVLFRVDELSLLEVDHLRDLHGLEQLRSAHGLYFSRCASLASLDGLDRLTEVGQLMLNDNPQLASIAGLGQVASFGGDVWIMGNALVGLDGLGHLLAIEGDLTLSERALESLSGLAALRLLRGQLVLEVPHVPDSERAELRTRLGS